MNGLSKVIKLFGTQERLADALGVSPMAVSQWKRRGVPADRVCQVVSIARGQVTPHQLRPDLYSLKDKGAVAR